MVSPSQRVNPVQRSKEDAITFPPLNFKNREEAYPSIGVILIKTKNISSKKSLLAMIERIRPLE